ncbi:MAG: hypothetical protein AAFV90_10700 [Cyanobacteria bacterium J06634_5]
MSKYYMVDVKSITSKIPRSTFNVNELEQLAQSILAAGGLLSPLLLQQTDIESYEVLAGDLEYYAASRAKEISPRKGEMVNAFIVSENSTKEAIEQFRILHKSSGSRSIEATTQRNRHVGSGQIATLEVRINEFIRDFKHMCQRDMQTIQKGIDSLQEQLPGKVDALEVFNHDSIPDLVDKMAVAGIKGKTAKKLIGGIEKARQASTFTSFKDIAKKIDGLADRRILTILDSWQGIYMGNAFTILGESEKSKSSQFGSSQKLSTNRESRKSRSEGQISNLEARIDEFARDFEKMRQLDMKTIGRGMDSLQEQLPRKVEALEVLNYADIPKLTQRMAIAGIKGKTAEKIIHEIEKTRKKSAFTSLRDVVERVNGLAERRVLTMIDTWAGLY